MSTALQWPLEWLTASSARFSLRSNSQSSISSWTQGRNAFGPHSQIWMCEMTMNPRMDSGLWRAMAGLIAQLGGVAGKLRVADVTRLSPQRDLETTLSQERWSDGTFFDDGTGWSSGFLPPTVFLVEAASQGGDSVVIGGLPASASRVLRRGDLLEIMPGGIFSPTPHLYMNAFDAPTDASGRTRVYISPHLRSGVAAGDRVALRNAQTVFRLASDEEGIMDITPPYVANFGMKLVEAVV